MTTPSTIPEEQREKVDRALRTAFGTAAIDDLTAMAKGHAMSLKWRVAVAGRPYLLKIELRPHDPSRHYANMCAAADAGVAPHVLYTNSGDRVAVTDFVEAQPLARDEALQRSPTVLKRLHAIAPFEKAPFNTTCTFLLDAGPARDGFLQQFRTAAILPEAETDELFKRFDDAAARYRQEEADLVASHNDLFKPDNILFDGDRIWLVDWEAAFLNDRYADLAVVANQLVTNEQDETRFLENYFGAPPTSEQRVRLRRMQQLSHIFYTMAFLHLSAAVEPIDWGRPVPPFEQYQERFWNGEFDLSDPDHKATHGRVHWERLRSGTQQVGWGVSVV